jgi:transcriptional regulator with XRE-family HTH domain
MSYFSIMPIINFVFQEKSVPLYEILYYALRPILATNEYYIMPNLLYQFGVEDVNELMGLLAENLKKRRLERGISRKALSEMSGVPSSSIAHFEQKHAISLHSYVALARSLGYTQQIKSLMQAPIYETMEELLEITRNKNRKRGRNAFKENPR